MLVEDASAEGVDLAERDGLEAAGALQSEAVSPDPAEEV